MNVSFQNSEIKNTGRLNQSKELTLSLPSMGPNFNFYKFKDTHNNFKSKFNETVGNTSKVDTVLYKKWGEIGLRNTQQKKMSVPFDDNFYQIMAELNKFKDTTLSED